MKPTNKAQQLNKPRKSGREGFTIVELLVVIALIAVLASILLPALSKARTRAQAIFSLNNTRQLSQAWLLYADDHDGKFAYNLGGSAARPTISQVPKTTRNWVNNVMTWDLDSDNTNTATITEASLGNYASRAVNIYRCPSDGALSSVQLNAGWKARVRSYSMNAMIGDAGDLSRTGYNENNPKYAQAFTASGIAEPTEIFVFIDEHPDSINDGYFLNRSDKPGVKQWNDLPASHHNGAAAISFVDGHSELHLWVNKSTIRPERPSGAGLPFNPPTSELADYNWVMQHMMK